MAPSKKSKSLHKKFSSFDEASPDKDHGDSSNGRQQILQKRKLSDMLGSQWSKEELERFYEAYRKYGKDWKKVAAVVRNRSIEMVEAIYKINKAYLSLPEGTASVVGLIAMMTDHYNVLGGSDSGREGNVASGIHTKHKKHVQGEVHLSMSKDNLLQSQSGASSDGCLSLLERRRTDGHAVGKRTPRFPVSHLYKKRDWGIFGAPNQKGWKSRMDANDDVVAHAALALTEASQRVGSPQVSQMPYRRTTQMKHPHAQSTGEKHLQPGIVQAKLYPSVIDEDCSEDNLENRDAENGHDARDSESLMHLEGVGTVEVYRRRKRFYGKTGNAKDVGDTHIDNGREACSGTEGGLNISAIKENFDLEVTNVKGEQPSSQGQGKKSKKQLFGDEASSFDALEALADLSLIASAVESESFMQIKDEKATLDASYKVSAPEPMSSSHRRDKSRQLQGKTPDLISGVEVCTPRKPKPTRYSESDTIVPTEAKLGSQSARKASKRKHNSPLTKAITEKENKFVPKTKHGGQNFISSKQRKLVRSPDRPVSNSDQRRAWTDIAASSAVSPATSEVCLPTKQRSRRKMDPLRVLTRNQINSFEKNAKDQIAKHAASMQDPVEQLSCCLTSPMVRRWCNFEWFYSAIDYPWFAKQEFVEYLNHVGLGHILRLTRVEWGVIRSSLGKPRRFSEHFLLEEKQKLKQYRECVRLHYAELCSGIKDRLPTDLARPLSVGQRVVALHPKTREVHDGNVLTVDNDKCRVQFDCPEMGVEFVMDIDCMHLLPVESMPEAIKRQNDSVENFYVNSREPRVNGKSNTETPLLSEHSENMHHLSSSHSTNTLVNQAPAKVRIIDIINAQQAVGNQPCVMTQDQTREADVQALSELAHTLDKKEASLTELRHTNKDVLEGQRNAEEYLKGSDAFKKHYATVSSAVLHLRQRNTFPGNSLPLWLKQPAISNVLSGPPVYGDSLSSNSQEAGFNVVEILKGSRSKANSMVDAAVQAMSSIKEGEDAFARINEALNSLHGQKFSSDSCMGVGSSPDPVDNSSTHGNDLNSFSSEPLLMGPSSESKVRVDSNINQAQLPSGLITSCVATLLMVQMCAERQYPPADVAQIIDSAVTSLHPCCPQNLPIYREIQMCMGRIRTQILALIPT